MTKKTRILTRIVKVLVRGLIRFIRFIKLSPTVKAYVIPELTKELGRIPEIQGIDPLEDIYRSFDEIACSGKQLVVGPWVAEVGFEVLYWIPFVRWFCSKYQIPSDKITVISRGGAEVWYNNITSNYIDIFDYFTPVQFKDKNSKRIKKTGGQKHINITQFDTEILETIGNKTGLKEYTLLHPSLMYNLFLFYWNERYKYPVSHIESHTRFGSFSNFDLDHGLDSLPEHYIAVKFYFNDSFPDNDYNRNFIASLLTHLTDNNNVVLLSTGLDLDDHAEYLEPIRDKLTSYENIIRPRNNLQVQSYLISRASAFIGTFGGFSYIAPFYNIPSYAIYSHGDKLLPVHPEIASRVVRCIKYNKFGKIENSDRSSLDTEKVNSRADFIMLNVKSFDLLKNIIGHRHSVFDNNIK